MLKVKLNCNFYTHLNHKWYQICLKVLYNIGIICILYRPFSLEGNIYGIQTGIYGSNEINQYYCGTKINSKM